ncbi:hypothetical protein EV195_1135 [Tenacibaculum skagerrakense]|uniref:Uncharacterized protein n=1 Tax=Tenacibaculum skagerrakense TaxID=186571 RepID=A0A4R2NKV4_9FLAO|nr:hypothetical protein EV195_1135 [Tenacibaculum skagerrakense]
MFKLFCGSPEGFLGLLFVLFIFALPVAIMVIIANIILKTTEFYKKLITNSFRKFLYFIFLIFIAILICIIFTIGL